MTSLRKLGWIYEFAMANSNGREKIQEYLKPKVKELLKLFTEADDGTKVN
jgi:flagellar biosynthesis regulator FlbT